MLFLSCQKWVWNWFWFSINFTLCSLWEVFHLFKFREILLFKRCERTTLREPQLAQETQIFYFTEAKLLNLLPRTLPKLEKTHSCECSFKGFLPLLSTEVLRKHASSEKPAWLVRAGTVSVFGLRRLLRKNFVSSSLFSWSVSNADTWCAKEIQVL